MDIENLCEVFENRYTGLKIGTGVSTLVSYEDRLIFVIDNEKHWTLKINDETGIEEYKITFGCVGGSRESGETVIQAIYRESKEEIGVEIDLIDSDITYYIDINQEMREIILEDDIKPFLVYENKFIYPEKGDSYSLIIVFKSVIHAQPKPSSEVPALFTTDANEFLKLKDLTSLTEFHENYNIVSQREIPKNGYLHSFMTPKVILDHFHEKLEVIIGEDSYQAKRTR